MVDIEYEITKEKYDKALAEGPESIISDSILMGYGCYGARVFEKNGRFYLKYSRGDSCD